MSLERQREEDPFLRKKVVAPVIPSQAKGRKENPVWINSPKISLRSF
jgi:hypothetical protein